MAGFLLVLGLLLGLVVLGAVEYLAHRANLASIPVRIHVNGTRGKSSVTRLITWAMNHAGIRTFGKTTGTLPRMLFPDGREYPVYRPGGRANVLEQLRIVAVARSHRAEAVVMECMALQPRLQWLSEQKLVQATHGVCTNAREDHLDVMGPTERDVALALAATTPRKNKMFLGLSRNADVFQVACEDRDSEFFGVTQADVEAVSDQEMSGFAYTEHKENVALVLKVCASLGIARQTAIEGMWKVQPDEGALNFYDVEFFGRRLVFVNGFAANDPESTQRIWDMALDRFPDAERSVAVFNCRIDRQHRSQQLGEAYATWRPASTVILMGTGTYIFARDASRKGCDVSRFVHAEGLDAAGVFERILGASGRSAVVVGMANIAGAGLDLVHYFANRSRLK